MKIKMDEQENKHKRLDGQPFNKNNNFQLNNNPNKYNLKSQKGINENTDLVAQFGKQSLRHANWGFVACIIALFTGVVLLIPVAILSCVGKAEAALIPAISGAFSEAIAAWFYRMYIKANENMQEIDSKNREIFNYRLCFSEVEKINDKDKKDDMRIEMIRKNSDK